MTFMADAQDDAIMRINSLWRVLATGGIILVLSYLPIYWLAVDSSNLSPEEISCGKFGAAINIDNPIERFVTRGLSVTHKEGDLVYISAYTFFGIPISKFSANCEQGSSQRL
jgi:hypothetical protein